MKKQIINKPENQKNMKIDILSYYHDYKKNKISKKSKADYVVTFETDWFNNTIPSIKDTDKFVPEWEDSSDFDTVVLYFLAEYSKELLETNHLILCEEAKQALMIFNEVN